MNMKLLIAVLLLGVTSATVCTDGDWGEWSEWLESSHDSSIASYPVEPEDLDGVDVGLETMEYVMGLHAERDEYRSLCLDEDSCPELRYKKSEGSMPCVNGLSNDTYPCWNVDQLSFMDFEDLYVDFEVDSEPNGNDCWGWYDAVEGEEYALIGTTTGLSMVRITDPYNPVTVGYVRSHIEFHETWRDMKVMGDFVYIVSENRRHGIQIFDLTRLRGRTEPAYLEPDAHYDYIGNCHNLVTNEAKNIIYAVGCTKGNRTLYEHCSGGLHAVDVSDPLNPVFAGCFSEDTYVHDAQCVNYVGPDTLYQGREVCFCYNIDTFTIVDAEDKENMRMISKQSYDTVGYSHQGWLTEDQAVVIMDDELDEYLANATTGTKQTRSYIWDMRNLTSPVLMNTYMHPHNSIDHNQYIIGDITFQANYESGLRILRIDQENYNLTEVAYFDVFPSQNEATFFGAFSVYPYLPSRNLVVSSIDYGLFILRPDYSIIDNPANDVAVTRERVRYRDLDNNMLSDGCPQMEIQRQ